MEVSKITAVAVSLNLLVGLAISAVFIFFTSAMMQAMNLQGAVLEHAKAYLVIVGGAIFLQAIINSLAAIIRVHGFTKQTMFISLGMNVIHVIGNYALIFGKFGMPALGVQGAAISSVGSRLIVVFVFIWLLYKVLDYRIEFKDYINWPKEYVKKILHIGLPSAFEQILYQACQIVFLYYVTYLGTEALAARQYALNISMFSYMFGLAIGLGTSIIVGRLVGSGQQEQAYRQVWTSLRPALVLTAVMLSIVVAFRYPLMRLFTDNETIIQLGATVLLVALVLEVGHTVNMVIINSLRASGDAKFPVLMAAVSMVLISLPLGYYFVFILDFGLVGIWLAIAVDEWIRATAMAIRWKSRVWERHALVEPSPAVAADAAIGTEAV